MPDSRFRFHHSLIMHICDRNHLSDFLSYFVLFLWIRSWYLILDFSVFLLWLLSYTLILIIFILRTTSWTNSPFRWWFIIYLVIFLWRIYFIYFQLILYLLILIQLLFILFILLNGCQGNILNILFLLVFIFDYIIQTVYLLFYLI